MSHPGHLFHMIGRWIKSAAAPEPSPELAALREATKAVTDAADHLSKSAQDIGAIVRKLRTPPKKKTKKATA